MITFVRGVYLISSIRRTADQVGDVMDVVSPARNWRTQVILGNLPFFDTIVALQQSLLFGSVVKCQLSRFLTVTLRKLN